MRAFKAILAALVGDVWLFMHEGENVEIFIDDDCKRATIKSMKEANA